jgi:glycerophosphoryl diester phosphodiesterase
VTRVFAHRGASRAAPANTLAAFRRAVDLGSDGVELDVHRTADRELVVRHDAATPAGVLAEMTLVDVRAALPDVPRLDEVLDECRGLVVNVEIKNSTLEEDWDPTRLVADLVVELLDRRGRQDDVLVSSFDLGSIDRVRSLGDEVPTALLTTRTDPLQAIAVADSHGHRALHPDIRMLRDGHRGEQRGTPSAGAVTTRAHELGLVVNVWTVNEPDEIARLAAAGVDGVITDVPDVAMRALGR